MPQFELFVGDKVKTMNSRHYAILAAVLYGLGMVAAMFWGRVEVAEPHKEDSTIYVEFIEPAPEPEVSPQKPIEAPVHNTPSEVDNSQQVSGNDVETRTINTRALFKMNKGGSDTPENVGNPHAKASETESAHGTASGLNPVGTDALDEGLQGRGLVGALPMPDYPAGNRGGKVIIRVSVDKSGNVTSATYEPKGSTTSDSSLVEEAIKAAKRAKFTESAAFVQGGTITYIFRLKTE